MPDEGGRATPHHGYSQKLERRIQAAAQARDKSKEQGVLEDLRKQLSAARVAVSRAGDSSGAVKEARDRLAAQEHALISLQSRLQAQDEALEATRAGLQAKQDQLHELQQARQQHEESNTKATAQAVAFKKERLHMQNRIRYLERELDEERLRRQGLENKGHQLVEELVKEQREHEKEKIAANRRASKLTKDLNAATAETEALKRSLADLQYRAGEMEKALQLKKSQLIVTDHTLKQTHLQFARAEENKKADAFQAHIETLWRNEDVGAIVEGMKIFIKHANVQQRACQALTSLAHENSKCQLEVADAGGVERVCQAMVAHGEHVGVQQHACATLLTLAFHNSNQVRGIQFRSMPMSRHIPVCWPFDGFTMAGAHRRRRWHHMHYRRHGRTRRSHRRAAPCLQGTLSHWYGENFVLPLQMSAVPEIDALPFARQGWWRSDLQSRIKAEGAIFRVQRAMEDPNAADGTITWGRLLLSRLESKRSRDDLLDCELEELVCYFARFRKCCSRASLRAP